MVDFIENDKIIYGLVLTGVLSPLQRSGGPFCTRPCATRGLTISRLFSERRPLLELWTGAKPWQRQWSRGLFFVLLHRPLLYPVYECFAKLFISFV